MVEFINCKIHVIQIPRSHVSYQLLQAKLACKAVFSRTSKIMLSNKYVCLFMNQTF